MTIEPAVLAALGLGYLTVLGLLAWSADNGKIPERLTSHPTVYTLSLGVVACSWAFFGSVSVAAQYSYAFMGFFIGTGALYLFAPLLLLPLMHICYQQQLTSLPDLLAFRYRGRMTGAVVALAQLVACLPLLALQIKLVTATFAILGGINQSPSEQTLLAVVFATGMTAFAIIFGVRALNQDERHNGLVFAMALESLIKIAAFAVIGVGIWLTVFDDSDGIRNWLRQQPDLLQRLSVSVNSPSSYALTLMFMVAALGLPQLLFMGVYETPRADAVRQSMWAVPFMLLVMSLPVLPILWGGHKLNIGGEPALFLPSVATHLGDWAVLLTYLVALSAASSTTIVVVLALSRSINDNLLLPLYSREKGRLIRHLQMNRSFSIVAIMLLTLLVSTRVFVDESLMHTGFTAFIGLAQFIPGLAAMLYWQRASRYGLYAGLVGGFGLWVLHAGHFGIIDGIDDSIVTNIISANVWASIGASSVALNAVLLVVVSLLTDRSKDERDAAITCSIDALGSRSRQQLDIHSVEEIVTALSRSIGEKSANRVVRRALNDLSLDTSERRPAALFALRQRVEAQLTRIVGAQLAMEIVQREIPSEETDVAISEDIYQIESRADRLGDNLTGLAADIDSLRRFYRETLQDLPVGVCGINADNEVVMWNRAIATMTGQPVVSVLGSALDQLPQPWSRLLQEFIDSGELNRHSVRVRATGQTRWVTMHRTDPLSANAGSPDARFVVVEDVTQNQMLQDELQHSERLASIGRLAAGVAHEIGNPVTAIDCLAQNLLAETTDEAVREEARDIIGQTHRISDIVQTLVNFAHSGANQRGVSESVQLRTLIDEATYFIGLGRDVKQVQFDNRCDRGLTIQTEPQRLMQVLINLLGNARDASEEDSEIVISASSAGDTVELHVIDQGCGIAPEDLDNIYEPFYTTKPPGEGTGLGLSLVYSIVRDLGGSIDAFSPVDRKTRRGTDMRIRLPLQQNSL